jgi:hypothetical protein
MWRILQNVLPVQQNLFKRGISWYPLFQRCNNIVEDHNHVFKGCLWAQQAWFASYVNLKIQNNNLPFSKCLEDCLITIRTTSMKLICVMCYHIWKARNLLIFQKKRLPVAEVIHQAQEGIMRTRSNWSMLPIPRTMPPKIIVTTMITGFLLLEPSWNSMWMLTLWVITIGD